MSSGVPRNIQIGPVMNGFLVSVGCRTLVFTDRKHLIRELERYLEDPGHVEKEYLERAIYRNLGGPQKLAAGMTSPGTDAPAQCEQPERVRALQHDPRTLQDDPRTR